MAALDKLTVRPAENDDLDSICRLLEASRLPSVGVVDGLAGFLVAESAGNIVGVVGVERCNDDFGLLRSTAVAESRRGEGIGHRLVERAISDAGAKGFARLYLLTKTAEDFFPRFGFALIPRDAVPEQVRATEEFRSDCCSCAAVMVLALGNDGAL